MEPADAYLLITRYLTRQTTLAENEQLAAWVAASAANEQTFQQLKAVWQHSQMPTDTAAALRRVKVRLTSTEPASTLPAALPKPSLAQPAWQPKARIYQVLAILLVLGVGAAYFHPRATPVAYQVCRTTAGQRLTLRLPDGSRVTLAPQSQLCYPAQFTAAAREVYLEGEVFFEVSRNPHRLFRVHSGEWVTQAFSTKFNVSAVRGASQLAVSLLEGKVQVLDKQGTYLLRPGQQLRAEYTTGRIYRQAFSRERVLAWRQNKLVFQYEKLADVAGQLERLYGVKLVFEDAATAEVRLWATFEQEPLPQVLAALRQAGRLAYRQEGQALYLRQEPMNAINGNVFLSEKTASANPLPSASNGREQ